MDRPGALAVKLNTRDRKGSGGHPGYGLKLSPATHRAPASRRRLCDTRIRPVPVLAKGCARLAPSPSVTPEAWGCPQLGGHRQRRALALEQLPFFQSSGAGLRELLERPWGRAVRRAASRGPGGSRPRAAAAGSGRCRRSCSSRFSGVVTHRPMEGSFWSFSVQDSCDALVSTSRPLQCCPRRRRRGGRGTRRGR